MGVDRCGFGVSRCVVLKWVGGVDRCGSGAVALSGWVLFWRGVVVTLKCFGLVIFFILTTNAHCRIDRFLEESVEK